MNILVTGGSGFIGSNLIRYLINTKKHKVLNIDKLSYSGNNTSLNDIKLSKKYFFKKIDICNKNLIKIFNDFKPIIVMHLAAESHVDKSIHGSLDFINTNINGTYNLLETSRNYYDSLNARNKKLFRFHQISTDEVFGDLDFNSKNLFSEKSVYKPSSPYSASKASAVHLVNSWHRTYGLPIVISNCSNNYGPFQNTEKLIPLAITNGILGKKIPVYGNGLQIRDWVYVIDHVIGMYKVALKGTVGSTYNIGGNNQITNISVVKLICKYLDELNSKNKKKFFHENLISYVQDRPGHDKRYAVNIKKIKKELGWYPKENFETGIKKTVLWYWNNRKWWNSK
jgi:dTDP-glucose 4,6-dehydratase